MFKVQKKPCSTCIYRKDSPLNKRLKIIEDRAKGSWQVCHHSDDVCCRGFWNRYRNEFNLGRIVQRLNAVLFVNVDTFKKEKPDANR